MGSRRRNSKIKELIRQEIVSLTAAVILLIFLHASLASPLGDERITEITSSGFYPEIIYTPQGTKVAWKNSDTKPHWPASDFHPTHDLYPQFDSKTTISPGGVWRFKFSRPGTWQYHDHLYPHFKGRIIVEKGTSTLSELLNMLRFHTGRLKESLYIPWLSDLTTIPTAEGFPNLPFEKQSDILRKLAEKKSAKSAWEYVKIVFTDKNTGEVKGNGHDAAHLIGNMIYEKDGIDGLAVCSSLFAFGCYHGFTEALLASEGLGGIQKAETTCVKKYGFNNQESNGCIHGIGHGILSFAGTDIKPALQHCKRLNPEIRPYCYDGVFMEFSLTAPDAYFRADDPWYPCSGLSPEYQLVCSRSQPQIMRFKLNLDTARIGTECARAPTRQMGEQCFASLGYFAGQESQGETEATISFCRQIKSKEGQTLCIGAAAGELIFQNYTHAKKNAFLLCSSLPEESRAECLSKIKIAEDAKFPVKNQ